MLFQKTRLILQGKVRHKLYLVINNDLLIMKRDVGAYVWLSSVRNQRHVGVDKALKYILY